MNLSLRPSVLLPGVAQPVSRLPVIGILSTHPPTLCGLATFSLALADGLRANNVDVKIVRIADGMACNDSRVIGEMVKGVPTSLAETARRLNQGDLAVIQHEYGIYGGDDGEEVLDVIAGLTVPSIVILHTVLTRPTEHQRWVLEAVAAAASRLVVISDAARVRLDSGYNIDGRKVSTIPHGANIVASAQVKRSGRPTLLTWGLLGPGKGIERVIDAMPALRTLPGRPRYVVAGRTHPKVLADSGEIYREQRVEQARRLQVSDAVEFEPGYLSATALTALIQSSAAVVLPYDSTEQVSSGVLVDALAHGRPVIATAFPQALELLSCGAGIVVPHHDPEAMVSALRRVLTDPRLAGSMAAAGRQLAPTLAWPVIATRYLALAQRLLANRRPVV
jgi:glycosyltransferase involved in cell wall biosynthesis